jgi:hypothetical protein
MPFCVNCGASIGDTNNFCTKCGTPRKTPLSPAQQVQPPPYTPQPSQPAPAMSQSKVINVLPQVTKKKLFWRKDIYTIAFTDRQAIFALLTSEILAEVKKNAQAQSTAEGKGWFRRQGEQMLACHNAYMRYLEMTPEQILAETPGNFAIDHASVASVRIRACYESSDSSSSDEYTEIRFDAAGGTFKYRISDTNMQTKEVAEMFNPIYPGKIKR